MSFKQSLKKIVVSLLIALFFLMFSLMILFFTLPAILENQITKKVSENLELKNFQIKIQKLGISNTVAGRIKTGKSLEIDSVDIGYSLKSLINKKIEKIQISGLTLEVNVDEKYQVKFTDFDLKKFKRTNAGSEDSSNIDIASLPFLPEKIEVTNSKTLLNFSSQQINIPFEIRSIIKKEGNLIQINAVLMPFREKIKAVISMDSGKGIYNIKMGSKSFDLYHLSQLIKTLAPEVNLPSKTRIDIETDITINKEKLNAHGILVADNPFISPFDLKYDLDLDIKNNYAFTLKALNQNTKTIKVSSGNQDILFDKPHFLLNLAGTPLKAKGDCLLKSEKAGMNFENEKIYAKKLTLDADFNYDFTQADKKIFVTTNSGIHQIGFKAAEHKTEIFGIKTNLGFSIPYNAGKPPRPGKFSIKKGIIDDNYVFKLNGNLALIKSGILINGNVGLPDIKDLILGFNTKVDVLPQKGINVKVDFHTDPFNFTQKNLTKFIPEQAKGIDFDINLSSKGKIEYSSKSIKSKLKIDIKNGVINIPDSKLSLNGITTSLEFNDLLAFRSDPAQVLNISSIKMDNIIINDAIIKYNIESTNSLFVESTRLKWCNGIVSSEALRIPNKENNYSLAMYCDRLELTCILEQMGAFHAEGSGTLSGKIPVTYTNGEIAFNNGFLFSSPGKGGKIMLDNADKLTAGIPLNTPQFSELDLAKEALKNYDYKWAKLIFNTFEDTLLVNMQFDGKPSEQVLPFEYKKELGRFVRVDASSRGSHFQGIKLDVNLKLPFNQVMKFGSKLKKALK